ncbi:MAG: hypothetical protein KJ950_15915 [Proteobacteria bacterium]|nr:hypothetical protein [Pseudomonadota bacterium]MBU1688833.1 hypothetical protein [Pseudomonadota bacterium]
MKPKNCWEVKQCGRQPGGKNVLEYGLCPVTISGKFDGVNQGENGGRFCWRIAGTLCGGEPQGTAAQKLFNCLTCEFFRLVVAEEGAGFILSPADLKEKVTENVE